MSTLYDIANSVHQGIKPVGIPMLLYCTKCGKRLMEIEPGGQMTKQIKGLCDCSWWCCDATCEKNHGVHMGYRAYAPGEERMKWYVHIIKFPEENGGWHEHIRIDNQPDVWAIQLGPTKGPFNTRSEANLWYIE
jgi:hypothetical protein